MLSVLTIISPIFMLIGIGYLATRWRLIMVEQVPAIGRFVLYLCLPALIFSTLSRTDIQAVLNPSYLLAYGGGSFLAFWLGFVITRYRRGTVTDSGLNGLGMSLSNSAFVGYPVLLQLFDTLPVAAFTMTLLVENLLIMPTALMVLEGARSVQQAGRWPTLATNFVLRLIKHPILIAIALGTAFSLLDWHLPDPVNRTLDLLADAAAGVALFVIGGSLVGKRVQGDQRVLASIAIGKLCVHPLLVGLMILVLPPFDSTLQRLAVLAAAMPMLSIYSVVAGQYRDPARYSASLVITTVLSFISIATVIGLLF